MPLDVGQWVREIGPIALPLVMNWLELRKLRQEVHSLREESQIRSSEFEGFKDEILVLKTRLEAFSDRP